MSDIVSAAKERYFREDVVVVRGSHSHDILVFDAQSVPDSVEDSDHHDIIHHPEGWTDE